MSKVIAEIEHVEGEHTSLLTFYHLTPEHIAALRPALLENGDECIHHRRAQAGAHVERWSPEDGIVSVRMYQPVSGLFVSTVCSLAGVPLGEYPRDPRWGN